MFHSHILAFLRRWWMNRLMCSPLVREFYEDMSALGLRMSLIVAARTYDRLSNYICFKHASQTSLATRVTNCTWPAGHLIASS